jgi:mannose-6-phosphate isomerase-like protein (cupin superfamily)
MEVARDIAGHVAGPGEGKKLSIFGMLKLSAEQSGGSMEVIEFFPGIAGPPPHVHRERDELFYITRGRYSFVVGTREIEVEQGGIVFVPHGTRHAFTPHPDSQALAVITPAGLEGFFRELGDGLTAGKSREEIRDGLSRKYDSTPTDI